MHDVELASFSAHVVASTASACAAQGRGGAKVLVRGGAAAPAGAVVVGVVVVALEVGGRALRPGPEEDGGQGGGRCWPALEYSWAQLYITWLIGGWNAGARRWSFTAAVVVIGIPSPPFIAASSSPCPS